MWRAVRIFFKDSSYLQLPQTCHLVTAVFQVIVLILPSQRSEDEDAPYSFFVCLERPLEFSKLDVQLKNKIK